MTIIQIVGILVVCLILIIVLILIFKSKPKKQSFKSIILRYAASQVKTEYETVVDTGKLVPAWDTSTDEFDLSLLVLNYAIEMFYNTNNQKYKTYFDNIEDIYNKLENSNLNQKPWGTNWYQFTVTLPRVYMTYHILFPQHEAAKKYLQQCLKLLTSPITSLGSKWTEANAVYVSVVWLYAHSILDSNDEYLKHTDLEVTKKFYNPTRIDTEVTKNATFTDGGVIFHQYVPYFGYIMTGFTGIYFDMFNKFFNMDQNVKIVLDPILNLVHPKTGNINPSLFGRTGGITGPNPKSKHKIVSMPSVGWVAYKAPKFHFMMRGSKNGMAYVEVDRNPGNIYGMQIWVFSRELMYIDQDYTRDFKIDRNEILNTPGVISPLGATEPHTFVRTGTANTLAVKTKYGRVYTAVLDDKLYIFTQSKLENDGWSNFLKTELICVDDDGITIFISMSEVSEDLKYCIRGPKSKTCKVDYMSNNLTLDGDNIIIKKTDNDKEVYEFVWYQGFKSTIPKIVRGLDLSTFTIDDVSITTDINTFLKVQKGQNVVFANSKIGPDKTYEDSGVLYKRDPYHYTYYKA